MSKFLDQNGLLYLWEKIKALLLGKVDVVAGKQLSTNDYTDGEKTKLAGLTNYTPATTAANGLMSAADKVKLDGFAAASEYAKKTDIAGAYTYKGSVSTQAALPGTGNTAGDVWNVEADGMNYAWTGSAWDALGATFAVEAITNAEIDAIFAT